MKTVLQKSSGENWRDEEEWREMEPADDAPTRAALAIVSRMPAPPCALLLGWRLLRADGPAGRIRVAFDGRDDFRNPAGTIQGGMLAAMLDDAMGPAILIHTGGASFGATISMAVNYLAPAAPGPLAAEARVLSCGRTVAFMEGRLFGADGRLLVQASASARLTPLPDRA